MAKSGPPWGKKDYGVLLVGAGGGAAWDQTVAKVRKEFGSAIPLEVITGTFGTRGIQKAVSQLEASQVKKIVVIHLALFSQSKEIDQLRYLLGIQEHPSKEYIEDWRMSGSIIKRVRAKIPILLGGGLDDHAAVADILAARAAKLSREPKNESVVLVGFGSASDEANTVRKRLMDGLAAKVGERGKFKDSRAVMMRPSTKDRPKLEEDSELRLRTLIKSLSLKSRVILLPHLLEEDGSGRHLRKKLDYLFYRWGGGGLLSDSRITQWVKTRAEEMSKLETMVKYKDEGKKLPPETKKRNVK